jgi:hypothetical protein
MWARVSPFINESLYDISAGLEGGAEIAQAFGWPHLQGSQCTFLTIPPRANLLINEHII